METSRLRYGTLTVASLMRTTVVLAMVGIISSTAMAQQKVIIKAEPPQPPPAVRWMAEKACTVWKGAATRLTATWNTPKEEKLNVTLMGGAHRLTPDTVFQSDGTLGNGKAFLSWCPDKFERCVEVPAGRVTIKKFDGELLDLTVEWSVKPPTTKGQSTDLTQKLNAAVRVANSKEWNCPDEKAVFWEVYSPQNQGGNQAPTR